MFNSVSLNLVKEIVDFSGKCSLFDDANAIPDLQSKGVTALCKILRNRQYAYLADEVGMGKTYQAIGVISMLLSEKPNAKILIITPNRGVQNNWLNEIENFKKNNLKKQLSFEVKNYEERSSFINGFAEKKNESIFLVRLSTFSTIADSILRYGTNDYVTSDKISLKKLFNGLSSITGGPTCSYGDGVYANAMDAGKICGCFLRKFSTKFDLVVIDEAQNMRNMNNSTTFLNCWLGLKRFSKNSTPKIDEIIHNISCKIKTETKYLLISATPAHRNIESLRNQLFYFENTDDVPVASKITREYLKDFLIRRLRTYDNQNKYDIRQINPYDISQDLNSNDSHGLEQRLFLALVQSKLAKLNKTINSNLKIGFLETLESYKPTENADVVDDDGCEKEFENGGATDKNECGSAPDKEMICNLTKSYSKKFEKDFLPHPKLSYMGDEISKSLRINLCDDAITPDKAVIFVRRIASVNELTLRLNALYEEQLVSRWEKELKLKNAGLKKIQQEFEYRYNQKTSRNNEENHNEENLDDVEVYENLQVKNKFLSWIALKNSHKGNDFYAVSKFKKSMLRNKPNSILFSENYVWSVYGNEKEKRYAKKLDYLVDDNAVKEINGYIASEKKRYILEYGIGKKRLNHNDLLPLCSYVVLQKMGKIELANKIKEFYAIKEKKEFVDNFIDKKRIKKILLINSLWNNIPKYGVDINLDNMDFFKRETYKAVVEKYLKSSEAVLDILYCYLSNKFSSKLVARRIFDSNSSYGIRIRKFFSDRELIYKQLFGTNEIKLESDLNQKLKVIDLQQWVMPATGGNKGNDGVIKRFNTPFYPDFIVCTDVLKEGINLHLFCNRIYHYGLAWTPGDLEQRVGRVDRFFSKTQRDRANGKDTKIEIVYPYLGKTIDEYQLKKVLQFRLSADPLLDSKIQSTKDIDIDLDECRTVDALAKYKPDEQNQTNFPYSGEQFWK